MSKVRPNDDPRQRSDKGTAAQTHEPWKGNPEKDQRTSHEKEIDLEKWQETKTH